MYIKTDCNLVFNSDKHHHFTRTRLNVQTPYARLSKTMKKPSVIGTRLYNKLPLHVRSLNLNQFKAAITSFLIKKAFYSIDEFLNGTWTYNDFKLA